MTARAGRRARGLDETARPAAADQTRRDEILQTAARLIASSGLRTSLQQIADDAGILPGSLYHHFESKDAILLELMRQYHTDLDRVPELARRQRTGPGGAHAVSDLEDLAVAIARFTVEHRAALQMSFYEQPSENAELAGLARRPPVAIQRAMLDILRSGRAARVFRAGLDLPVLADRICQSMLHIGLDVIRHDAAPEDAAALLCRIVLGGLATADVADATLDRSAAFTAADEVIQGWPDESVDEPPDKAARIRAAARAEFGRRGYEGTTARDIAAAAGLPTTTVYRFIGSKDALLMSIMRSFGEKVGAGWTSVLRSESTPLEKLDALSWINVNALDRFSDEFRIQLAWMRQSPPDTPAIGWSFGTRLRQMKRLIADGIRAGEIRRDSSSLEMVARCVMGLHWIPGNILTEVGRRVALIHVRDTLVRGIAVRDRRGGRSPAQRPSRSPHR
ncbi:MAG TPA: TetR/AcrR family transcriptional regulator [Rugosimonospora sp.]|nr:TetR/AcrR family transcriptional regulator [Rugosimonospora sp.]